jgi:hypothetical protein
MVAFMAVMSYIQKARYTALQYMTDETSSVERALEDAKDTARKLFPGSAAEMAMPHGENPKPGPFGMEPGILS